jgi:hypothetical protein
MARHQPVLNRYRARDIVFRAHTLLSSRAARKAWGSIFSIATVWCQALVPTDIAFFDHEGIRCREMSLLSEVAAIGRQGWLQKDGAEQSL